MARGAISAGGARPAKSAARARVQHSRLLAMCRSDKTTTRPPPPPLPLCTAGGWPRDVTASNDHHHKQQQQQQRACKRPRDPPRARQESGRTRNSPLAMLLASFTLALILLARNTTPVGAVDCFKCSSRNGSNPACEDPFHNLNTTRVTLPILPDPQPSVIYHTPCYAGRKNRDGLFPASACIKLTGVFDTTGETLVVRHCALDSGSLTQDTELARMSHCGKFQFEGDLLRGCVLACPEDACNSAHASGLMNRLPLFVMWLALALLAASTAW